MRTVDGLASDAGEITIESERKTPRKFVLAHNSSDHAPPGCVHRCHHNSALDCRSRHAAKMDRHRVQSKEQCHPPRPRNLRSNRWHRPKLHRNQYQPPEMYLYAIADGGILVQLTALGAQYQCAMCRDFDPEFAVVAQSWRKAHPRSDGVFFATLDFAEGRQIFMRVCLRFRDFKTKCAVWDPVCPKFMGISAYHWSPVQVVIEQSAHYIRFPRTVNSCLIQES